MASLRLSSFRLPASLSRLSAYIRLLFYIKASLGGTGPSSHTANTPGHADPAVLEFDQSSPTDPAVLCDLLDELTRNLQSRLPGCEWLEEGAIEFIGDRPIDAGQVANIFVGMRGNIKVAVKCYRFYPSSGYLPAHMRFRKEALACGRYKNQSFVPFVGIYSTPQHPMCIVFEYMEHSNLREYLRKNKDAGRRELLLEVARGLEHLHNMDVIHKNVKITNILVDVCGHAHLGGLGTALVTSDTPGVDIDRFFHGAAPELADNECIGLSNTRATKASDVYAFGVLAWESFAGQVPFSNKGTVAAAVSMRKGHRPARPNHPEVSNSLWRMIQGCWKVAPGRRMEIVEVVAALEKERTAHQPNLSRLSMLRVLNRSRN